MEKTTALQYGQVIKGLRIRRGLSQKEFAKLLYCPVRTLQDWETGKRQIPLYELYWLQSYVHEEEEDLLVIRENNPEFSGLDLNECWKKYLVLYF